MLFDMSFDKNSPKYIRCTNIQLGSEIEVVEIGYNKVPPGKVHILTRDVYIIHYVLSGRGVFQNTEFDAGCVYVTVPGELEIITADDKEPYETCWVMFRGTLAHKMFKRCKFSKQCGVHKFDRNQECGDIIKNVLYKDFGDNELTEAFELHSVFYQLMAQHMLKMGIDETKPNSVAKDIAIFLSKNYNWEVKIDSIANMFNYSRNHLYTLFKKEYGVSPKEYLLNLRIEKAKQILSEKDSGISIKEVAFAVGFKDPLYFSRVFSNSVGMSPMQFKSRIENE